LALQAVQLIIVDSSFRIFVLLDQHGKLSSSLIVNRRLRFVGSLLDRFGKADPVRNFQIKSLITFLARQFESSILLHFRPFQLVAGSSLQSRPA
jgi:hypothetical protein